MIAEQFGYLVDQTKGYNALERFRATCGGPLVFPGITMFAEELKKRQNKVLKGKPSLGNG